MAGHSGSPAARRGGEQVLERHQDVANLFWGSGEEWPTGIALSMVAWSGGGGSLMRGRRRVQG
jgi:hypothetical protein